MATIDPAINAKLNPPLVLKIATEPEQQHAVTITFTHALSRAETGALGLTGEGTVVYANLDAKGIWRVAASPDVARVSYRPSHSST